MTIKDHIEKYFELEKAIHDYFGYKEDWTTIPMANELNAYWMLLQEPYDPEMVVWSYKQFDEDLIKSGKLYSSDSYVQKPLLKWVYRAKDYTMVSTDPRTDGNKYLIIFDNARECTDEKLKQAYRESDWY